MLSLAYFSLSILIPHHYSLFIFYVFTPHITPLPLFSFHCSFITFPFSLFSNYFSLPSSDSSFITSIDRFSPLYFHCFLTAHLPLLSPHRSLHSHRSSFHTPYFLYRRSELFSHSFFLINTGKSQIEEEASVLSSSSLIRRVSTKYRTII